MRHQLGDVEHLVEGVDLDHPGLAEHRVDGRGRGDRGPHRVAHRHALRRTAGLHRHHRLAAPHPAGDPGELPRVADRLQVEQHDLRRRVLLPVLQQVVARDVGPVTRRHEGREAEAPPRHGLQDRHSERSGLAEEANAAAGWHHGSQRRVQRDVDSGVDHAQAVGADEPQPVGAGEPDQLALALASRMPGLCEAARDHDQPVHPLGRTVEHHVLHGFGGYRNDRQVDAVGNVLHGLVRRHAGHRVGGRVDDVHPAGVAADNEVAHQQAADGVLPAAGADDGHAARDEEALHGTGLGAVLPRAHDADRGVRARDGELQPQHAVLIGLRQPEAGLPEGLDHPRVVRQYFGDERDEAPLARGLRKMLEQQLPDAAPLVAVLDQEGHLGLPTGVVDRVVPADRDDVRPDRDDEGGPVPVVNAGEAIHVALRELRVRREEPHVLGLR